MSKTSTGLLQRFRQAYMGSRMPWKRHVLVGTDLSGNEFYEMPNPNGGRSKRWIQFKEDVGYSDFDEDRISVQWSSWLRHTRPEPPTIHELIAANSRRELTIQRARELDQQWEERKRFLESQTQAQIAANVLVEARPLAQSEAVSGVEPEKELEAQPRGQGDTFQPGSWSPGVAPRR